MNMPINHCHGHHVPVQKQELLTDQENQHEDADGQMGRWAQHI